VAAHPEVSPLRTFLIHYNAICPPSNKSNKRSLLWPTRAQLYLKATPLIPTAPSAPPQNLSGSAASSTVVLLMWSLPPPLEVNGIVQHYTVNVVERHTGIHWTFVVVDQVLRVGGLHPHYQYDFNVSATTVGRGPFSTSYSLQTLPEGICSNFHSLE
jgi:hypothetical protein